MKKHTTMARKREVQLTDACSSQGTIHVDESGIYSSWAWGLVRKHTHDYKFVTECRHWGSNYASFACGHPLEPQNWIFTSFDTVFSVTESRWRAQFPTGNKPITGFMYHPGRSTYLVAYAGKIAEIGLDFRLTSHAHQIYEHHPMMIPSTNSSDLYMISLFGGLEIVHNDVRRHIFNISDVPHTFVSRPGHTDVLTMVQKYQLDVIDLWHTSSVPTTSTHIPMLTRYAAYVNPNVCAVGAWNQLQIIDLRCGSIRVLQTGFEVFQMWHACGRVYANAMSHLYVLD